MYDTVSAVLGEVPEPVRTPQRWDKIRQTIDPATGEVQSRFTLNTETGLLLTLHGGGRALQAERSLPKVHRGQNIEDLIGPAVSVAIAQVDAEIADALGYHDLPTIAEWLPVRVDYPTTIVLPDEATVYRTLGQMASVSLPYKGLPTIGDSGSVTWAKGEIHVKAYSKFLESHDDRARGLLRIEPGVFRARSFRKLLGWASDAPLTLMDVLTPVLHQTVNEKYAARLRGDVMSDKELRDRDLFNEMVALFGPRRTATLLGWALMWGFVGVESREEMLAVGLGSSATRYRILADYRRFRDVLLEKGYALSETGDADADVEQLVHTVALAQAA
jgi:hypothetical protein